MGEKDRLAIWLHGALFGHCYCGISIYGRSSDRSVQIHLKNLLFALQFDLCADKSLDDRAAIAQRTWLAHRLVRDLQANNLTLETPHAVKPAVLSSNNFTRLKSENCFRLNSSRIKSKSDEHYRRKKAKPQSPSRARNAPHADNAAPHALKQASFFFPSLPLSLSRSLFSMYSATRIRPTCRIVGYAFEP